MIFLDVLFRMLLLILLMVLCRLLRYLGEYFLLCLGSFFFRLLVSLLMLVSLVGGVYFGFWFVLILKFSFLWNLFSRCWGEKVCLFRVNVMGLGR